MSVNIVDPGLSFSSLSKRGRTTHLIIHHAAAEMASVETIHQWHKGKGWAGIGYNFYIRRDGGVFKGRGWEYIGAHATNSNSISVGICFEGDYESKTKSMPDAQFLSGAAVITLALEKYPTINTICGHRDIASTACPGRFFPLDEMIAMGKLGNISAQSDTDSNGCPYGTSTATVKDGGTGEAVCRCQWYLNEVFDAELSIDGICGSQTLAAIRAFQEAKGLDVDGVCGSVTWAALESAAQSENGSGSMNTDNVAVAIENLVSAGIINTPDYWLDRYSELQYLDQLLINMSGLIYQMEAGADITTIDEAFEKLEQAGAINTVDYWKKNYLKLQYVDQLVIKAANRL